MMDFLMENTDDFKGGMVNGRDGFSGRIIHMRNGKRHLVKCGVEE